MNGIIFEKLNNIRGFGGMIGANGRKIKPGKLIRSGRLALGTEEDIRLVGELASVVVDFRSDNERAESPDPEIEGVKFVHIPIIRELAAGVSRDKKSDEEAFRMLASDPEGSFDYMCRTYGDFVTSESAHTGYHDFVKILLEDHEKAVLWHCTAGKDRAGFASVIVLEMLGVAKEDIIDNYYKTNEYIASNVQRMVDGILKMAADSIAKEAEKSPEKPAIEWTDELKEKTVIALRNMFEARKEYLEYAYAKVDELYGDFRTFLLEGLKLDEADIERMRELYLE